MKCPICRGEDSLINATSSMDIFTTYQCLSCRNLISTNTLTAEQYHLWRLERIKDGIEDLLPKDKVLYNVRLEMIRLLDLIEKEIKGLDT